MYDNTSVPPRTIEAAPKRPPPDAMKVQVIPSPFQKARLDAEAVPGQSVREMIGDFHAEQHEIAVVINGQVVEREDWDTPIEAGDVVKVVVIPMGGIGRTLAFIALTIAVTTFTGGLGAPLTAQLGSLFGRAALAGIQAGITVGGALLINHLIPAPQAKLSESSQGPQTFGISGIRNSAPNRNQCIPNLFGTMRMYPFYGARPFTEIVANKQYLNILFDCGYGPLEIADTALLRIGDRPFSDFTGLQYEFLPGTPGATSSFAETTGSFPGLFLSHKKNFNRQHRQERIAIALTGSAADYTKYTGGADTKRVVIELTFPNGLVKIARDGGESAASVAFSIRYRAAGSTDAWTTTTQTVTSTTAETTFFWSHEIEFATADAYELEIKRTTADDDGNDDVRTIDRSIWTAVDWIKDSAPVTATGRALFGLRIQATDQLNGMVDTFSLVLNRKLDSWTAADGWSTTPAATSNPAWVFAEILRGVGTHVPVDDGQINAAALKEWADYCDSRGYTCNAVFDARQSIWSALSDVGSIGRAKPTLEAGNVWSVIVDRQRTTPIDLISPRDSTEFRGSKAFIKTPHALIGIYRDASDDSYDVKEIIVYDEGYSASNATDVRRLEMFGSTNSDEVHKRIKYHIAESRLRPERFEVTLDVKNLGFTRGDYVDLTHDVALIGLGVGRVSAVEGAWTGFSLDAHVPLNPSDRHSARFQTFAGAHILAEIENAPADSGYQYRFVTALSATQRDSVFMGGQGAMCAIGVMGLVTLPAIVQLIQPQPDLSARLVLVPLANEIHDAETGTIPDYNPRISLPDDSEFFTDTVLNRIEPQLTPDEVGVGATDGAGIEFVFQRTATDTAPAAIVTTAAQRAMNDFEPADWHDAPPAYAAATPYLWAAVRTGSSGAWGEFSTPVIWSVPGADGNGVQFVYRRTATVGVPNSIVTTDPQRADDDHVPANWTDDPKGPTVALPYEWVAARTGRSGAWDEFSDPPALWSQRIKGQDGRGNEFIFARTATDAAPTTIVTTADQRAMDEYRPAGWTDDPKGATTTLRFEWVSERSGTSGAWGEFSAPAQWAHYSEDGEKGGLGEKGDTGPKGVTGNQGQKGGPGEKGDLGPKGVTGNQGVKGEIGTEGGAGPKGVTGNQGVKGEIGTEGVTGPKGVVGIQGPAGSKGLEGDQVFIYYTNAPADTDPATLVPITKLANGNWTTASGYFWYVDATQVPN